MSVLKIRNTLGEWEEVLMLKGDKGDDGKGISSAVLNSDYTLTLTFTDGTTYTTSSIRGEKGEQGDPATSMEIHICSSSEYDSQTRIPTIQNPNSTTFYLVPTSDGTSPDLFTEWVYVNNAWEMFGSASVDLTDYVKNTDIGTTLKGGVFKVAADGSIKAGSGSSVIVPTGNQHKSTFYGLAKAAGHDEKDSTLPVGQYTDEAKSSIQSMLGVPSEDEVVTDVQVNGTSITTDGVAEIPIATDNQLGVVQGNPSGGTQVLVSGQINTAPASSTDIKAGIAAYKPITPNKQHESTFYALATASGDTTQKQSENPIGQYTDEAKSAIQNMLDVPSKSDIPDVPVEDVQINGSSIVSNGVANVPIAGQGVLGTVKTQLNYGVLTNNDGRLYVDGADSLVIKNGADQFRPVVPYRQHESAFYSLAKAAGDTTQSASSNAVGNYTDNAKDKIQTMLGVSPLIASHESDPFESNHVVGELFIIGGKLYRAKTALTAGEYVNEGTNVEVVSVAGILDDYATKQEIENNINIVEKNNSGSIVSFSDGADGMPMKSLIVNIDPVQDLHGQDAPYPAGGGKNKFDPSAYSAYLQVDGTFRGRAGLVNIVYTYMSASLLNTAVTFSATLDLRNSGDLTQCLVQAVVGGVTINGNRISNGETGVSAVTFTPTSETDYVHITFGSNGNNDFTFSQIQLETGSSVTSFATYENICPISGWTGVTAQRTGKNLFDKTAVMDGYIDDADGELKGTSPYKSTDYIRVVGGNSYYVISEQTSSMWGAWYDGNKNYISRALSYANNVITAPSNASFVRLTIKSSVSGNVDTFAVNSPSTFTDYVPYNGNAYSVNWQSEAGTVYGGHIDVVSGELLVDRAMVDLGTLTWDYESNYNRHGANLNQIPNTKIPEGTIVPNAICSKYKIVSSVNGWANRNTVTAMAFDATYLRIYNDGTADAETFKTALSGVQLVYELATPIVYHLSPTEVQSILGENHVWADTGDCSVEYFSQVDEDLVDYIKANLNSYAKKDLLNNYINDVQINGTSITNDGVANIPYAAYNKVGVVQVNASRGTAMSGSTISTFPVDSATVKAGIQAYQPITPAHQHESVFYGLAKASGDVTQVSSDNAVGTYTDNAKSSIKTMLGVDTDLATKLDKPEGTITTSVLLSDFTVTTAQQEGWKSPHALSTAKSRIPKNARYIVTYNGTDYHLPCQLWGDNNHKVVEFLGNISLYANDTNGFNQTIYNVPFCIISDLDDASSIDVLTTTAETATFKITKIFNQTETIDEEYIYGSADSPFKYYDGGTSTYSKLSIGNANLVTSRGGIAIGSNNKSTGEFAIATGYGTLASGNDSLSEGNRTLADGYASHAEGVQTEASGNASHTEGLQTVASGIDAHAEGWLTTASGMDSHAEGGGTIANHYAQHVFGTFNIADTSTEESDDYGNYIEIVGNGGNDENRSNARTLDWSGNERLAGSLTLGANTANEVSLSPTELSGLKAIDLTNYITNTDYATYSTAGVVKVDSDWGIGMYDPAWSSGDYGNFLYISPASSAQIKAGSTSYKAIVPSTQHESIFYGLAKASGDTTQTSSSNAVGTYTEEAKTAIKQMLGIHDTIDSFVEDVTGTDVTITGQPSYRYNCGEVYSLTVTPPSSGTIDFRFTSGSTPTVLTLPSTVKMPEWWVEVEANTIYEMCITDGVYCGVMSWAM